MKKILFIATEFPPLANTGVHRSVKFVKYLQKYNIDPIVVTLTEESGIDIFGKSNDNALSSQIPNTVKIHRIPCKSIKPYYRTKLRGFITIFFSTKDIIGKVWNKQFALYISDLIKLEKPSAIYATLPPFSIGKLATKAAKTHNIPLIIDMRDGWLTWRTSPFGSYLHYLFTKIEEKSLFKSASVVIGTTKELISIFSKDHPQIAIEKFHWIPNGFDGVIVDEFVSIKKYTPGTKLKIGYIGSFYYSPKGRTDMYKPWWRKRGHRIFQYTKTKEDWLYRSPHFFILILNQLAKINPAYIEDLELHFVGHKPEWIEEMIQKAKCPFRVVFHGWQNNSRSVELLSTFDTVFVTSAKRGNDDDWPLPSKIFDYITKNKLIIAVAPNGATKSFIQQTQTGIVLDPDSINESAEQLHSVFNKGIELKIETDELKKYDRKETAKKLANIIFEL